MTTFIRRVLHAAMLDPGLYEEVEADAGATGQAVVIVLLSSIAGGIGLIGLSGQSQPIVAGVVGALAGWVAWATLTYVIGAHFLPEPQTQATLGELLRTIAFASAPGLLRLLGVIPIVGFPVYVLASIWMLVAMIVAVRQALDYRSTARAVAVCAAGWMLSLIVAAIIGIFFAPTVS